LNLPQAPLRHLSIAAFIHLAIPDRSYLVPYQPKTCQKKQENFHTGLEIRI
jgi:hypothetical protein